MKKALLVGINRYPDPRNELQGCVNDVRQMADTLKTRYGFPGDGNMRILTDARATTKAILDGSPGSPAGPPRATPSSSTTPATALRCPTGTATRRPTGSTRSSARTTSTGNTR